MSMVNSSTNHVAVIVLNWNGLSDTIACLSSLENSNFTEFDIVLVDNGSVEKDTTNTLEDYASNASIHMQLLQNDTNLGFSGGVNTGIRYALSKQYTHIALINNDAVIEASWIKKLLKSFSLHGDVGIVTGSLLHKGGKTIDSTGEMYTSWGLPYPRGRGMSVSDIPSSGYVFAGTGGATMYKREVFESIGLFDEALFAYYEDVDLGFRAQLSGWKTYYQAEAVAYHTQGASSSRIPGFTTKQAVRNLPIVFIKNVPFGLIFSMGLRFYPAYLLIVAKALLGPNSKQAFVGLIQGFWLFWTHGVRERFSIQKNTKVKSSYIGSIIIRDLPPDQPGLRKLLNRPVQ